MDLLVDGYKYLYTKLVIKESFDNYFSSVEIIVNDNLPKDPSLSLSNGTTSVDLIIKDVKVEGRNIRLFCYPSVYKEIRQRVYGPVLSEMKTHSLLKSQDIDTLGIDNSNPTKWCMPELSFDEFISEVGYKSNLPGGGTLFTIDPFGSMIFVDLHNTFSGKPKSEIWTNNVQTLSVNKKGSEGIGNNMDIISSSVEEGSPSVSKQSLNKESNKVTKIYDYLSTEESEGKLENLVKNSYYRNYYTANRLAAKDITFEPKALTLGSLLKVTTGESSKNMLMYSRTTEVNTDNIVVSMELIYA